MNRVNSTKPGDRQTWHFIIVLVVGVVVLFTGLGASRLWDRDEPRNAGCAAEMMARGDWVVPMFNDELRPQKPVLLYWLIMASYAMLGQSEWAARLPSALMGLGTIIVTWRIGCRLVGPRAGLLAALVLATSMMFLVASRAATPDATLIFLSTLAIGIYIHGVFGPTKSNGDWFPKNIRRVVAMYAVLGLAVLGKGPVGLILPMAIIGMFMLIQRLPARTSAVGADVRSPLARIRQMVGTMAAPFQPRHFLRTFWSMQPWIAVLATLVIAAPWYILVGLRTEGEFLRQFFWTENIGRATTSFENHSGGPWYYPLAILIGFFPWSVLVLPMALQIRSDWTREAKGLRPAFVLLFCWVGVQVGLFTLASTKLPSYVTPCYPALALLTGVGLDRWLSRASRVGIMSDSSPRKLNEYLIALSRRYPDKVIKVVHSDSKMDDDVRDIINNTTKALRRQEVDALLCSPSVTNGVDFNYFDTVFVLTTTDNHTPNMRYQAMMRERQPSSIHFYFKDIKRYSTGYSGLVVDNGFTAKARQAMALRREREYNTYTATFNYYLVEAGAKVVVEDEPYESPMDAEAKEEAKNQLIEAILLSNQNTVIKRHNTAYELKQMLMHYYDIEEVTWDDCERFIKEKPHERAEYLHKVYLGFWDVLQTNDPVKVAKALSEKGDKFFLATGESVAGGITRAKMILRKCGIFESGGREPAENAIYWYKKYCEITAGAELPAELRDNNEKVRDLL